MRIVTENITGKKNMKAISLKQPWAGIVVAGVKDIENRSWSTKYRGKILIHASKKFDKRGLELAKKWNIPQSIITGLSTYLGGIIGEVEIIDCVTESNNKWFEGPYGFVLKNAKVLPFYPCKGRLGIFDIDIL